MPRGHPMGLDDSTSEYRSGPIRGLQTISRTIGRRLAGQVLVGFHHLEPPLHPTSCSPWSHHNLRRLTSKKPRVPEGFCREKHGLRLFACSHIFSSQAIIK